MWSAFWLQKPSILRVCFREEDPGPGGAGESLGRAPPGRAFYYTYTYTGKTKLHCTNYFKKLNSP